MASLRIWDPKIWFSVGVSRRPKGWLAWVVTPLAVALAVYVIVAATVLIIAPWTLVAVFLTGIIAHRLPDRRRVAEFQSRTVRALIDYTLSLASFVTGVYFFVKAPEIVDRISLLSPLSDWDLFFGVLTVLLTAGDHAPHHRRSGSPLVVLIFIAYNFFGHLLSGVLQHG